MEIISGIKNIPNSPSTVVTMGTFDGVHLGHQEIIAECVKKAKENDAKSVLITYVPHPREVISEPNRNPILFINTLQERLKLISDMGLDYIVVQPFNKEMLKLDPERFIKNFILKFMKVKGFVVGYSHSFGKERKGSPEYLKELGETKYNFFTNIVPEIKENDTGINSTNIRRLLAAGDIENANRYLGRPFHIKGAVVRGDNRGSKLGFPTINVLPISPKKIIPHIGVYCVTVYFKRKKYRGMCNIGYRPTFDGEFLTIEIHLLNVDVRAKSGNEIYFKIHRRLRDEIRFNSKEELIAQLNKDKIKCNENFGLEDS